MSIYDLIFLQIKIKKLLPLFGRRQQLLLGESEEQNNTVHTERAKV
jgi:hypothetical protein